jgi:hypothetical protein
MQSQPSVSNQQLLDANLNDHIKFAQLLFKRCNFEKSNKIYESICIKVDGLDCALEIIVSNVAHSFTLCSTKVQLNTEDEWYMYKKEEFNNSPESMLKHKNPRKITINEFAGFLLRMTEHIKILKFDKYIGRFIDPTDPSHISQFELDKVLRNIFTEAVNEIKNLLYMFRANYYNY